MCITVRRGGFNTFERKNKRDSIIRLKERCQSLSLSLNDTLEILDSQIHTDYFYEKDKTIDGKKGNGSFSEE